MLTFAQAAIEGSEFDTLLTNLQAEGYRLAEQATPEMKPVASHIAGNVMSAVYTIRTAAKATDARLASLRRDIEGATRRWSGDHPYPGLVSSMDLNANTVKDIAASQAEIKAAMSTLRVMVHLAIELGYSYPAGAALERAVEGQILAQ